MEDHQIIAERLSNSWASTSKIFPCIFFHKPFFRISTTNKKSQFRVLYKQQPHFCLNQNCLINNRKNVFWISQKCFSSQKRMIFSIETFKKLSKYFELMISPKNISPSHVLRVLFTSHARSLKSVSSLCFMTFFHFM